MASWFVPNYAVTISLPDSCGGCIVFHRHFQWVLPIDLHLGGSDQVGSRSGRDAKQKLLQKIIKKSLLWMKSNPFLQTSAACDSFVTGCEFSTCTCIWWINGKSIIHHILRIYQDIQHEWNTFIFGLKHIKLETLHFSRSEDGWVYKETKQTSGAPTLKHGRLIVIYDIKE